MRRMEKTATGVGMTLAFLLFHTGAARGRTNHGPVFSSIMVSQFTVKPQPFPGAPGRRDEEELLKRLSEEAAAQAERTLLGRRLAGSVGREPMPGAGPSPFVLTGEVRLPVSLPPGLIGFDAASRKEVFATVALTLRDGSGEAVDSAEVGLRWRDARWLRGAKRRRNRPLDAVLVDFTRKSVDRAVRSLSRRYVERKGHAG